MLCSGFNTLHRSAFWSADFNGRSDNTDVIVLMKHFSLSWLFLLVALAGAIVALLASSRDKSRLRSEIAELKGTIDTCEYMIDYRDKKLLDSQMGTSVIYRIANLGEKYSDLFEFLDTIPPKYLSCNVHELPDLPSVRLVTYYQNRQRSNGEILPSAECKSAQILIGKKSLNVVDYIMHNGNGGASLVSPYTTSWDLPDGSFIEYEILATGFELAR